MSTPDETEETKINSANPAADSVWRERPNADKIPCPALLSFYNNGLLNPDQEGKVTTAHLVEVLASVGVSAKVRKALVKIADETDEVPESFNLFALRDSSLDHRGSTGIRDPDFNPEKLDNALLKFSENGRMYAKHFAAAANQAQMKDPGFKGTTIQTVEFTALLEVFGRVDEFKKRYVTVDDVKGLWIDGKYPKDWQPRAADEIGVGDVTAGVAVMTVKRLLNAIGF